MEENTEDNRAPIEEVVDYELNPETELEPTPLASPTAEDNSAIPQRDDPVHNTSLSSTFDNINDSFPEPELEPECSTASRKRQRKAYTDDKRTKNKKLRMNGKEYTGFRNTGNKKYIQDSSKPARKLGEKCGSVKCLRSQVLQCEKFTESERLNIYEDFWKLSWEEKKMFVCSIVDSKEAKRKTTSRQRSRRTNTKVYYLKLNEQKERVCQKTFLRTLGIKEWTVRYWMGENSAVGRGNDDG